MAFRAFGLNNAAPNTSLAAHAYSSTAIIQLDEFGRTRQSRGGIRCSSTTVRSHHITFNFRCFVSIVYLTTRSALSHQKMTIICGTLTVVALFHYLLARASNYKYVGFQVS